MKYLKKYNEMLSYSGGDVTNMPIIGKVITRPIGPFESGEYDIVEVIETERGPIYVANMWYKERVPQLIHSELVEEFIPSTNESFSMYRDKCDRCKGPTNNYTTMSIFNEQIICMDCKKEEREDPEYKAADKAADEAYLLGVKNFKGSMPNYTPIKRN
jgi:hypothetical protein